MSQDTQLAWMRLVSAGCLVLVDIGDAAIRSQGQLLVFALHLNYVGIYQFAHAGWKEIMLRINNCADFSDDIGFDVSRIPDLSQFREYVNKERGIVCKNHK